MAKVLKKKLKFKNEYVLGRGRPWGYGLTNTICSVGVNYGPEEEQVTLDWPYELNRNSCPEYEIILRKVK